MGWLPGKANGAGDEPGPRSGILGGGASVEAGPPRDGDLSGFAEGGAWDTCPPGPDLAAVLARVTGREWRCPEATDEELTGILGRLQALESWAAAGRLGVIREMIRRDDLPFIKRPRHGDLPDDWAPTVDREISLALGITVPAAGRQSYLAWDMGARLPGITALLEDGTFTFLKARITAEAFSLLTDETAAQAEAILIARLAGKLNQTPGQLANLAAKIAAEVDPGMAERRRKAAEKVARVELFREPSGTAALSGRDLPPDETLAANASVSARAAEYRDCGAFGDARMDQYRATAFLDLLNSVAAWDRIAYGRLTSTAHGPGAGGPDAAPGSAGPHSDDTAGGGPGGTPSPPGYQPRLTDLVLPLATLLGQAGRPGESHGFGTLDPALCRHLAAIAIRSIHTTVCLTVTDREGIAIGHGCLRFTRPAGPPGVSPPSGLRPPPLAALPARLNLTITADHLTTLLTGPPGISGMHGLTGWGIAPAGTPNTPDTHVKPGDPDWCGRWTVTLPGGLSCSVRLGPVPTLECDHRHESDSYQPSDTLRHLVQVRDRTCTFPTCSRHARESDFEHAVPYDKGGRTDACNAGARSRSCHKVKQSPGWKVTQPRPGWPQWQTPSGRTYTQGPHNYPV